MLRSNEGSAASRLAFEQLLRVGADKKTLPQAGMSRASSLVQLVLWLVTEFARWLRDDPQMPLDSLIANITNSERVKAAATLALHLSMAEWEREVEHLHNVLPVMYGGTGHAPSFTKHVFCQRVAAK
jgi:hypothetical protein